MRCNNMDIEIRPELKELFKKGYFQKAIKDYDIDKIYKLLADEFRYNIKAPIGVTFESLLTACTYQLTYILKSIGIEPEKYLNRIPAYFYYSETFDVLDLTNTHIEQFNTGAFMKCSIGTLCLPKTLKNIARGDFLNSTICNIVFDMKLDAVKELLEDSTLGLDYPYIQIFGNDLKNTYLRYCPIEQVWIEEVDVKPLLSKYLNKNYIRQLSQQ